MIKRNKLLFLIMICLLIGIFQPTIFAADTVKKKVKVLEPTTLGNVKLSENVTASVNNLIILPTSNNQTLGLTLTIKNNGNKEINFLDYWMYLYTKSGTKLNLKLTDTTIGKIPAKTSIDINFIGTIGKNVKATDLIIKVVKWDFSAPSYTRVLGQITVTKNYNPVTPSTSGRAVVSGDVKASFIVKQAVIGKSEKYYRPEITLVIRNDGNRSIILPDYQLFILTNNNLMYPLTVKDIKGSSLDPLTEKEFRLTTQIPLEVNGDNWKLAVINSINEGKDKQPLALFNLPKAQVNTGEVKGKYYTFSNSKGIYNIKLNSLNRLPMEDNDLIIANLTVANTGTQTLPLPVLSGKYLFNESIEKPASSANNNKAIAIKPGATVDVQLVGKVPYTFDISNTSLIVQQKDTTDGTSSEVMDLVEFSYEGVFDPIKKITGTNGFKIEDVGYRSEVKVRNQMIFNGDNADILVAQLTIQNQEKRLANIQRFAGYFEKSDGTIYPATFDNVTDKLTPSGNAIVYVTTTLPKNSDTSGMNLVVGKAITETTSGSGQEGQNTENIIGFATPYSLTLPQVRAVQLDLQKIDLLPFELTFKRVATQVKYNTQQGEASVILDFDYSLTQDLLTMTNLKDHKFIVEIKDSNKKAVFTKELVLPTTTSTQINGEVGLQLGDHTLKVQWDNQDLNQLIQSLKNYDLNIYYQMQTGYKTLVATQNFPWLSNRTLS